MSFIDVNKFELTMWVLVLAILAIIVLYIRQDRLAAHIKVMRLYFEAHLAKALADRSPWVRIPAETLKGVLQLQTRTIPMPKKFAGKPKHPAFNRSRKK